MSKHPTKLKEINNIHVSSKTKRIVYRGFFSVEEHELTYQKFNKTQSDVVKRSALVSSDAVIVLPYDPINERVLLIEQFRTGPYVKGDNNPWVLEPIAGLVDKGESPETAGVREAQEEAHLKMYRQFFKIYKQDTKADVEVGEWQNGKKAHAKIKEASDSYCKDHIEIL